MPTILSGVRVKKMLKTCRICGHEAIYVIPETYSEVTVVYWYCKKCKGKMNEETGPEDIKKTTEKDHTSA